jgi:hypothetical protein
MGRIGIREGSIEGTYGTRVEEYCGVSGLPKRSYRVFDKVDSSNDATWEVDFVYPFAPTGASVVFYLCWQVDGLQTGNVIFGVKGEKLAIAGTTVSFYTDTFGTATESTVAVPTTANSYTWTTLTVPVARLGSATKNDTVRLTFYRKCSSASDTFSGSVKLVSVQVEDVT